jgi:non-specific serine/threonine protein kinase
MLETIREYAAELLEQSGELASVRQRHLEWIASETCRRRGAARRYEPEAFAFLRAEQANVREALASAIERPDAEPAQRIIEGLWFYWITSGLASEGDGWAMRVAALESEPTELYAEVLSSSGEFARFRGDLPRALALKERSIAILEQLPGDEPRIAAALAATLTDISSVFARLDDFSRATGHAERALSIRRELGVTHGIAHALGGLAYIAERRRAWPESLRLHEECLALIEEAGEPLEAVWALNGVGNARRGLGDLAGATSALEEAIRRSLESGDKYQHLDAVRLLGLVHADDRDCGTAVRLLAHAAEEARISGLTLDGVEDVERVLSHCRETLGDEAYEEAHEAGVREV